ncbi:unnamed protein product [Sphenostylis stenocarpa]|uniref:Vacuolar protein sorting-associated protein 62 n=1 Tax=Sphenostylis stenocarpa TaxID=92480 RepID=A0AA86T104_9FABA|nr:unnamed protein product [Sphenostylis stenocarpa]
MGVNVGIFCALFLLATQATGFPEVAALKKLHLPFKNHHSKDLSPGNFVQKRQALAIDTIFKLPVPVTNSWPPGGNFASGIIDLGGLQVHEASTFMKVWGVYQGGADGQGFSVFEPTGIPQGFSMLGSYCQPNNKPLFGWILVAKDVSANTSNPTLKQPLDYTLVWNSASLKINQDVPIYIWLPTAPDGYKAVGHVVTNTPDKPALDKVRCVRSDFTDQCETKELIWGLDSFNVYDVRPSNRGIRAAGVRVGTFVAQTGSPNPLAIACLKNNNAIPKYMPNLEQIKAILKVYSPTMCLHPDEQFFPSSVEWFFSNGALLYKKGEESSPVRATEDNLPQDPNNDGAYWLDLPADPTEKERVKKGDLKSAKSYVHVKPMLGGTFTDVAVWVFYPFNGPARAKVEFITLKLGKIGEHVGDWEHVTLRLSNFNGELKHVYFSQHSKGIWLDSSQLEFQSGNKPLYYSSLNGHASYPDASLHLLGINAIGIRNDTGKGDSLDMGTFQLVAAEYLGSAVVEPGWLNYFRKWGPKIDYNIDDELKELEKHLPGMLKSSLKNIVSKLPSEVLEEEGPTGPKEKDNWNGDER